VVVGRNKEENDAILALRADSDLLVKVDSIPGPVVLVVGEISREIEDLAAAAAVSYSDAKDGETAEVLLFINGSERRGSARSRTKSEFQPFIV
jgi:predicted ribosome quality control (RQC) complex YloA/Tae2 family protein